MRTSIASLLPSGLLPSGRLAGLVAGLTAVSTLGLAGPAFAQDAPAVASETCSETGTTVSAGGAEVDTGHHVVCESHHVSSSGVTASVSVNGRTSSVSVPISLPGGSLVPAGDDPSPAAVMDAVCGIRAGEWTDIDDPRDLDALYRRLVACLGMTVYENTVCDPPRRAGESDLECWATDYLVGDYLRNAVVGWLDASTGGLLPPVVKQSAQDALDALVGITNGETPDTPVPAIPSGFDPSTLPVMSPNAPDLPALPGVEVPDLWALLGDLPGQGGQGGDELPDAQAVIDEILAAATAAIPDIDAVFAAALRQADGSADAVFGAVEQSVAAVDATVIETRRAAEQAVDEAIDRSGQRAKADALHDLADRYVERTARILRDRVDFLQAQLGT